MIPALIVAVAALTAGCQDREGRESPRKAEVVGKLNTLQISLDFKDKPFDEVVAFLREYTAINMIVDPGIRDKIPEDRLKVTLTVKDLLLKTALKLLLHPRDMTAVYRDEVLVFQHKDLGAASTKMEIYDVRDLLLKIQDFPGPTIELDAKAGIRDVFPAMGDEPKSAINDEFLLDVVKGNTGDKSWEENPNASISLSNGLLIVSQTRKVHEEIRRLIGLLRQYK